MEAVLFNWPPGPSPGRMTFKLADQVFAGTDKSFADSVPLRRHGTPRGLGSCLFLAFRRFEVCDWYDAFCGRRLPNRLKRNSRRMAVNHPNTGLLLDHLVHFRRLKRRGIEIAADPSPWRAKSFQHRHNSRRAEASLTPGNRRVAVFACDGPDSVHQPTQRRCNAVGHRAQFLDGQALYAGERSDKFATR